LSVCLGDIEPDHVRVQLFAEPIEGSDPEVIDMEPAVSTSPSGNELVYTARTRAARPAGDYTPRIVPFFPGVRVPMETPLILWFDRA